MLYGARLPKFPLKTTFLALASACATGPALAFQIDAGNPDLRMSLDNTVKYSAAWRVEGAKGSVADNSVGVQANTNDGDQNFGKGLISNRFDLLSEFDLRYKRNYGLRLSGAAWYDDVYNKSNDNPGALDGALVNSRSVKYNQFTDDTQKLHGRKAELLDAFLYGSFAPGDMGLNLKAGRFTQLYGESLFFGSNGIAAAQTSLDLIKALSVPNSQFKEILRPVGQFSGQLQITPDVSIGAYYQLEWRKSRLPGAGSYFSFADFVDEGGETLILGPGVSARRGDDIDAKNSGQGGLQLKVKSGDFEYGLYAAQFHDKMPQFYLHPDTGVYEQVYGEDIRTVGFSVSTLVGETNVAAEMSFRDNMPLVASGNTVIVPESAGADGNKHAAFPVGRTLHMNLSAVSVLSASPMWDAASFLGEIAFNRRLSITDNKDQLDPLATRDATALQFIFSPEYFQVLPGLDVQLPVGLSYGLSGRSSVNGVLFPSEHGGNVSFGIKGEYQKTVQASLNFTHYYGPAGSIIRYDTPAPELSYKNFHGDRDFISLSIQRTF
ncbi:MULTISPECIES: DUF1302 domain-containing protein [Pseudomonas]|jgi:hypothetical protein|uniref:DUF1302 domain-containing protein n=1 Tax=Pseudomonas veronii 1YdBTEX2 TaxID=1295141 RepID=A0A1D3JYT8_PSEVE|nr:MULTISPECIES: DUF1302 domain-containing protein [Pseudomonas]AQY66226.1 hypothetical protein PverR02_14620 [Pseudomonas veronii]MBJ2180603.1 DUF1302 domain-containing protein [Pseudomonas veronii]MDF3241892.1 DUF1302 domain-containing protein [Pseudomonas veronii]UHH32821.1 DUF1302 domain-containing protein [Pseudomonas veronii]SBW81182.1 hypothetical protein PVE_R1G3300 [Pseudomonas veronii 1YdBTEX2]